MHFPWASKKKDTTIINTENKSNPFLEDFRDYIFISDTGDNRGNLDRLPRIIKDMDGEFGDSSHPRIKDTTYTEEIRRELKGFGEQALNEVNKMDIREIVMKHDYWKFIDGWKVKEEEYWKKQFPKGYLVEEIKTKKVEVEGKEVSQIGEVVGGLSTAERRSKYEKSGEPLSQENFIERFKGTWKIEASKTKVSAKNEYGAKLTLHKIKFGRAYFTFEVPPLGAEHSMSKVKLLSTALGGEPINRIPLKTTVRSIQTKSTDVSMAAPPEHIKNTAANLSKINIPKDTEEKNKVLNIIIKGKKEILKWFANNFYKMIEGMQGATVADEPEDEEINAYIDTLEGYRGMDLEAQESMVGEAEHGENVSGFGEVEEVEEVEEELQAMQAIVNAHKEKENSWASIYKDPYMLYNIHLKQTGKKEQISVSLNTGKISGVKIRLKPVAKLRPAILGKLLTTTQVARSAKKVEAKKEGEQFTSAKPVGSQQTEEVEEIKGEHSKMGVSYYLNYMNSRLRQLTRAVNEIDRHEV